MHQSMARLRYVSSVSVAHVQDKGVKARAPEPAQAEQFPESGGSKIDNGMRFA
eukprot:SAG11_NODE_696_length_7693_cov_9.962339_3_plen_53_part_00